jgi:molecular chaperone DnaK (HSP70)
MDIGIDLGTTFSVIAVVGQVELDPEYGEPIYLKNCDVSIIPSPFGERTFPSVATLGSNPAEDLFGSDALGDVEERPPITFSKRKIGTNEHLGSDDAPVLAREVAARFLRHLKQCAESALGQAVRRAVVTHPAYFDRTAVEETRQAAVEAGFDMSHPDQLVMEPVAAALAYTRTDARDPLHLLTYDLGGGTFDVTVLERVSGVIDMLAFDGDALLGGYNFDRELVAWLRRQLGQRGIELSAVGDSEADRLLQHRLFRFAEQLKISLAKQTEMNKPIDVRARNLIRDVSGRDVMINERVSRADFEAIICPLLKRTTDAILRALKKAKIAPENIDEVLLVGGSSRGPWVSDHLQGVFGDRAPLLFEPDLCIAAGAALHAAMVLPQRLEERGIEVLVDVPDHTDSEVVQIGGTVRAEGPLPSSARTVRLLRAGVQVCETQVAENGGFFFEDVELDLDEANVFCLTVGELGATEVIRHEFTVCQDQRVSDTTAVTTVLPQTLSIDTQDGLIALVAEGEMLPARVDRTFRRLNNNPTMMLRLFQAGGCIGEVRIVNIPQDAGIDSPVDLVVEVTASGQIVGHARIWNTTRKEILAQAPVEIQYQCQEVLSEAELRQTDHDLRQTLAQYLDDVRQNEGDEAADVIVRDAEEVTNLIDGLFSFEPVDRQEIQARLAELRVIVQPPRDTMRPTWKAFRATWAARRASLESTAVASREVMDSSSQDGQIGLDESMIDAARDRLARVREDLVRSEELYEVAKDAHQRRDRRVWGQVNDAVQRIGAALEGDQHRFDAPTPIIKLMGNREVVLALSRLYDAAANLEREGRATDWEGEIRSIHGMLVEAIFAIEAIGDDLDDQQGRAAVQAILIKSLRPAEDSMQKLGTDISTVT